jgi:hypothetical protein
MKLEVVVIPVSDVDRAKEFYERIGWRLNFDRSAGEDFRLVQFTPTGSCCSVHFGKNVTSAAPGSGKASPVCLAAWLFDHGDGYGQPAAPITSAVLGRTINGYSAGDLTRDNVLDDFTLYWLTNTAISAARFYWELHLNLYNAANVSIPAAVSVFPGENYQAPRSWTERAYDKLIYYNKVDKGGHYAAWEQPQLFSEELRAGFRSLRSHAAKSAA